MEPQTRRTDSEPALACLVRAMDAEQRGGSIEPLGLQEERPVGLAHLPKRCRLVASRIPLALLYEQCYDCPETVHILAVWFHALLSDGTREVRFEGVAAG